MKRLGHDPLENQSPIPIFCLYNTKENMPSSRPRNQDFSPPDVAWSLIKHDFIQRSRPHAYC